MKILFLNWQDWTNPQAGGAEVHIHELTRALARRGHAVTLLVSGYRGGAARETLDGVEVMRVGGRHTYNVAAPAAYRRRLRRARFDVVVETLNKVPLFAPLWTGRPTCLLVHHLFGTTAFQEASLPVAAATWLLEAPLPLVYRGVPVVTISESTADDLAGRGLDRRRMQVIPVGVDVEFFTPGSEAERAADPLLLYLGRVKKYKGVDLMLRALAELRGRGLPARAVVAGQGDYLETLRRLAAELGIAGAVEFAGYVSEERKRDLYRRAWVHVLPSAKEGWGITNVEAGACATPTVASDSPGLRESVVDGELRRRLGLAAREYSRRFSWDASVERTVRVLEAVAAGERERGEA